MNKIDDLPLKTATHADVHQWLSMGWRDLRLAGLPSLIHGFLVSLISVIIALLAWYFWPLLPGAVSGFVLVGPIVATGLYGISKRLELDGKPDLSCVLHSWRISSACMLRFTLLILAAATAWVIFSAFMFINYIDYPVTHPVDFLRYVITQNDLTFFLWLILGALGSALAFAVTVVSMPLLVERNVNTIFAIRTSIRVVGNNPIIMVYWALIIMFMMGLSFATFMIGFIVLYPLLGHASWHAYRHLVDASALPLRDPKTNLSGVGNAHH